LNYELFGDYLERVLRRILSARKTYFGGRASLICRPILKWTEVVPPDPRTTPPQVNLNLNLGFIAMAQALALPCLAHFDTNQKLSWVSDRRLS